MRGIIGLISVLVLQWVVSADGFVSISSVSVVAKTWYADKYVQKESGVGLERRRNAPVVLISSTSATSETRQKFTTTLNSMAVIHRLKLLAAASMVGFIVAGAVHSLRTAMVRLHSTFTVPHPTLTLLSASVLLAILAAIDPAILQSSVSTLPDIHFRRLCLRLVAALFSLSSGFSLGIAGITAEIGILVAHILSNYLFSTKLAIAERRTMYLAGAAAGISANFLTPLTGIVFAIEVAPRLLPPSVNSPGTVDKESQLINNQLPVVASFIAVISLSRTLVPQSPRFTLPSTLPVTSLTSSLAQLSWPKQLSSAVALGVTSGWVVKLWRTLQRKAASVFNPSAPAPTNQSNVDVNRKDNSVDNRDGVYRFIQRVIKIWLRQGLGLTALLTLVAVFQGHPQSLPRLFPSLQALLVAPGPGMQWKPWPLRHIWSSRAVQTLVWRLLLTSMSLAAVGTVGGLFAPSVYLGGALGAVLSSVLLLAPSSGLSTLFVLSTAAAVLSATFSAPLLGAVFVLETMQHTGLAAFVGLAAAIATAVAGPPM